MVNQHGRALESCAGDHSVGLRNLNTFMREQGADVTILGFPDITGGGQ